MCGLILVLFLLWILGVSVHFGGSLIHLLLVLMLVIVLWDIISGQRNL